MHDRVTRIAGREQNPEAGLAALSFVGELAPIHAAGHHDIGEKQVDFRLLRENIERRRTAQI